VTDNNNCIGKDTIIVFQKDCLMGLFTPSAFTPNRDGKNDVFKPVFWGAVKQFKFVVYNRWGEVVFTTSELNKGWDGTVKGVLQDSGVFIWTCTYKFDSEKEKMGKGTVVLLK
jgi:gliding motility-associated-like protein